MKKLRKKKQTFYANIYVEKGIGYVQISKKQKFDCTLKAMYEFDKSVNVKSAKFLILVEIEKLKKEKYEPFKKIKRFELR